MGTMMVKKKNVALGPVFIDAMAERVSAKIASSKIQ